MAAFYRHPQTKREVNARNLTENFKSSTKPRGKVKYNPARLIDLESEFKDGVKIQSTDRKGGGMSGKFKKKLMKERRRKKSGKGEEGKEEGGEEEGDELEVGELLGGGAEDEKIGESTQAPDKVDAVAAVAQDESVNPPPELSSLAPPKNTILTLTLQLSELPSMNSQKAKKARDKQQKSPSCKHYFTNSDVKVMDRWISLLPKCKMR